VRLLDVDIPALALEHNMHTAIAIPHTGYTDLLDASFKAGLEPVDIQDSLGLANLIQAPFWMGALNVGGSPVSTGRSMGTDGFALAG
jgi:hypothetical protein